MYLRTSRIKKFVSFWLTIVCLPLLAIKVDAQESYKVDEALELRCDLSEVLQISQSHPPIVVSLNASRDAKAAIIVYGLEGDSRVFAREVKMWMSRNYSVDPGRLIEMYGGPSESMRLELWLIPPGASPPKVLVTNDTEHAVLFDTYVYWSEVCRPDRPPALAQFEEELKKRPTWSGYIVIRPFRNPPGTKAGDVQWDPDGDVSYRLARRRASRDRLFLLKRLNIPPSRIRAIVGNDGKSSQAELWLVPPGATPPLPRTKR